MCVVVKPQEEGEVTDQLFAEIKPAVDGANYIIKHMRNKNDFNEVREQQDDQLMQLIISANTFFCITLLKRVNGFISLFVCHYFFVFFCL